jgi:hypothetical protein
MADKQQRKTLIARVSPDDYERIVGKAKSEARSVGETLALMVRENELMARALSSALAEGSGR